MRMEGLGLAMPSSAGPVWPSVDVGCDLERAQREWLHANGAGAYAGSTLACMHTRRYHGLLVAALEPPLGRHVFLSHVDATIAAPRALGGPPPSSRFGAQRWELAKHQFPAVDPFRGPFYLERFDQDPLPRWTYRVPLGQLEITLALVRGQNAAVLRYRWQGPTIMLTLRPLLAARSAHHLQREHGGMLQRVELRSLHDGTSSPIPGVMQVGEMRVQPRRELPRICFRYEGTFVGSPDWWRRFEYLVERAQGLEFQEDLWTPGVFEVLLGEAPSYLVAAVEKLPQGDPEALLGAAEAALLAEDPGPSATMLQRRLSIAAETFRADLAKKPGVIAGYPWFDVLGRDTLLALPGLYLVPKKLDGAMRILRDLIASMQDGLIPSGDGSAAPDATLWFFEAARLVADALGEGHSFVTDELLLALRDAFDAALRGTRHGVHITGDGLFAAGNAGDELPWLAGRVRGPLGGAVCPVELSALWARGCDTIARLARAAGDLELAARAASERARTRVGFGARFWCEETGYPYDVISTAPGGLGALHDASVRPHAVIALAVDPACFTDERAAQILDRARQELVTRAGLRTLAPSDPRYVGRHDGGALLTDGAARMGAVYPWLLGFFIRAARQSGAEGAHIAPLLERLVASAAANEAALGHVPEIADGDPPHAPGGCIAHALCVAELLRAASWDLTR